MNFRNLVVQPAASGEVWDVQTLDLLSLTLNRMMDALGLTEGSFGMAEQYLDAEEERLEERLRFDLARGDAELCYQWREWMNSAEMVTVAIRNLAVRTGSLFEKQAARMSRLSGGQVADAEERMLVGIYGLPWRRRVMLAMVLEGGTSRLLVSCCVADANAMVRTTLMAATAYLIGSIYEPLEDQKMADSVDFIRRRYVKRELQAMTGQLIRIVDKILARLG